jgi:hypothetical protein
MIFIISSTIWDLSANFEALQAVTKEQKLVTGRTAGADMRVCFSRRPALSACHG